MTAPRPDGPRPASGPAGRQVDGALLRRLLSDYPFQPATALFRAVELAVLLEHGLPPGRGLDLGCGDGLLTRILMSASGEREIVGLEPDPLEAKLAVDLDLYASVHVAPGGAIPEADGTFDWVLSNSVLEHVDDVDPVLREVARVLKPGGQFLFTVPSDDFRGLLRGPLLPGVSRERYLKALDRRLHHLRYWPSSGWPALPAGLSVQSRRPYLTRSQLRRWETISRFTAGALVMASGGRRRPIEIQRDLGLRRGARTPAPVAGLLAGLLAFGVRGGEAGGACELVVARKVG